jgi:L,D-transpeptidase catalytic domain
MTVSRRRHYWMVGILGVMVFLLTALLLILLFGIGQFGGYLSENAPKDTYTEVPEIFSRLFLEDEEIVIIPPKSPTEKEIILKVEKVLFEYVEVTESCGPHFEEDCLVVRGGPGFDFPVVSRLRNGIVLKVGGKVEHDGIQWYKIVFDETLYYPERLKDDWYIAAEYVEALYDEGDKTIWDNNYSTTTGKKIVVDRSEQKLSAYDGETLFMDISISTGLELTPTPRGTFSVFKKTPSRYMQGPLPNLPSKQYYDLPGVPWNLYFTHGGAVIHGAYWHTSFGTPYSHGCVNLSPADAKKLYYWAELGTQVVVQD